MPHSVIPLGASVVCPFARTAHGCESRGQDAPFAPGFALPLPALVSLALWPCVAIPRPWALAGRTVAAVLFDGKLIAVTVRPRDHAADVLRYGTPPRLII